MRSSRTREPLLLNKHESSRLIYRFTRPLVVTYFLTDGLSHNKVTQVIKACGSGELRISDQLCSNVPCFQSQTRVTETDCKRRHDHIDDFLCFPAL